VKLINLTLTETNLSLLKKKLQIFLYHITLLVLGLSKINRPDRNPEKPTIEKPNRAV
jgi:hypothetical protein